MRMEFGVERPGDAESGELLREVDVEDDHAVHIAARVTGAVTGMA